MKKILTLIIFCIFLVSNSPAQQKVTFSLAPYRVISSGIVSYMVRATVPTGQVWKVGNFNLKIAFSSNPAGCLAVHTDNVVDSALSGLTGGIYTQFKTSYNSTPPTISMDLMTLSTSGFLNLGPGTYNLGHIRFNITTPFISDTLKFRNIPLAVPITVVYDSTRKCAYGGTSSDSSRYMTTDPIILGVEGNVAVIPTEYNLYQNYPNPFNPTTNIKYDVPKTSLVKIKVYDITGKVVSELVNQEMSAGRYEATWNGTNFSSGVYFYKIETADYKKVLRMVLIK